MTMARLPPPFGSAIDRSRPLDFTFEGVAVTGLAGDTIASALAANGQWALSRSFKYHRPRSLLGHGLNEAAGLVQLPGEPNVDADTRLLEAGMAVRAQNVAGSLRHDRGAVVGKFARFLPVGFYYRTFFRPGPRAWLRIWEPIIRRAAGLGAVDQAAGADSFERRNVAIDVAVVGGGASGMKAALAAADAGAEVLLIEREPSLGGSLRVEGGESLATLDQLTGAVRRTTHITVLTGARCSGWFADGDLVVATGGELLKVRTGRTVFATGGYEQPLIFPGNDLPGIMFGRTAQLLMNQFAVRPGHRAVVVTNGERGNRVAANLCTAGVEVAAILDLDAEAATAAAAAPVVPGAHIRGARGTRGNWHVRELAYSRSSGGALETIACDLVCIAAGSLPAYHLPLQTGAVLTLGGAGTIARIVGQPENIDLAGTAAAETTLVPIPAHVQDAGFVDFDEDVQVNDIRNAVADGYHDVELVKRFTTAGMGTSQGRLAGLATASVVARELRMDPDAVRLTTTRPPAEPEELGRLAGPAFAPVARTAMHAEHIAAGAVLRGIGGWLRPALYRCEGEPDPVAGEVRLVRERAGLLDVSTLGKIEVRGAAAGEFLDRLYTMSHAGQPIGRVRYGLMLNEMGSVLDDGVVARLSDTLFYVTATSSGVEHVFRWMLKWRARWCSDVDLLDVTSAFGAMNLAGPHARAVLSGLPRDIDFGVEAFPYLHVRTGQLAGVPVRVMRIGFTGELAYELHAPRSLSAPLWRAILAAGAAEGLRPYGVEASRVLRLEKGHIIVGQDTDAMTTPAEIGFEWAVSRRKPFFIGRRSLQIASRTTPVRRLVGFVVRERDAAIEESLVVLAGAEPVGWITSTAFSPTLQRRIGMAMMPVTLAAEEAFTIRLADGRLIAAARVELPFFDPTNSRQSI